MNYSQFKEGQCPEGVSTQLNMLAKMGRDDELAEWLSVEYSFGSEYLLYPALLWPKKINLYCLNRPDGWIDTYENEHNLTKGIFPIELKIWLSFHLPILKQSLI